MNMRLVEEKGFGISAPIESLTQSKIQFALGNMLASKR